MARQIYDDNVALSQLPLTVEEVEALLTTDGTFFTRDPRRVRHLLTRMRSTFTFHLQQMRDLQRSIEHMHAAARTKANPVSAALEALRQLDIDEQRQVFDVRGQALVDAVVASQAEAERMRTAAKSEANRVRFALAKVLEDPHVPADTRSRLIEALALVPEPSEDVTFRVPQVPADGAFSVPAKMGMGQLSEALFGEDD